MEEIWRDIEGYEGLYQVSNFGRVKTFKWGNKKIMRMGTTNFGYHSVQITKDGIGKHFPVHRLVALNFIPNPENKRCVNHIDGNKTNNKLENLEWCTYSENNKHAYKLGLRVTTGNEGRPKKKVKCVETGEIMESINSAARKYNCSRWHLADCCKGLRKRTGGYHWEFVEEEKCQ